MSRHNHPRRHQQRASNSAFSTLRIIGGEWRSRKIEFPAVDGVRPTPDRVRETLFNWLQSDIAGARCLDLFSGSGALGLEALSRGAAAVTFVDKHPEITRQLKRSLQQLKSDRGEVVQSSVVEWLESRQTDLEQQYDIVFMDPPFHQGMTEICCSLLESRNLLSEHAWVYVETERQLLLSGAPASWKEHRQKAVGEVMSRLYLYQQSNEPEPIAP